jgi:hypothetical protein
MRRLRMFLIAAGYEDGDDCDALRNDPAFKLAVGRLPETGAALCSERLYETGYCARGQAENFIKLHKTQLASDRTSCRSLRANQFRLVLHTPPTGCCTRCAPPRPQLPPGPWPSSPPCACA